MDTTRSADGTTIAYDKFGAGPAVVLVGGAFNDRDTVGGLAQALAPHFTTYAYDRRGRGDSTDEADGYDSARELEDLAAVIDAAGGEAAVFGHSSGAVLALKAAAHGLPITRLAVYEPPYIVDDTRPPVPADSTERLIALVARADKAGAARLFLEEKVGVPAAMVEMMQSSPVWEGMEALGHSLPYDAVLFEPGMALPADELAKIAVPTLAIDGGESPPSLRNPTVAVADAITGARHVTIEGQDHGVLGQPEALVPTLVEFLA